MGGTTLPGIKKKYIFILGGVIFLCLLILIFLLTRNPAPKSENDILLDIQESTAWFSAGGELLATGCEITKRRTDEKNFSDVIYLDVFAENEDIDCTLSYIVKYELYNDGWELESVERDWEGLWQIVPLHGMTDEQIQEKLDYYISEGWYDTVELIDRKTELDELSCNETVTLYATKDHYYGTEEFTLTQNWYFEPLICAYTAVTANPTVEDCSLILKDTIVGTTWTCNRYYDQFDAWPDKFNFTVEELAEEDGKVWIKFIIQRTRNTYWDISSSEPVNWGMSSRFVVSTYMEYLESEDKWGFNLENKNEYLYSEEDDERFTENDWFCFSLEENGSGYIIQTGEN